MLVENIYFIFTGQNALNIYFIFTGRKVLPIGAKIGTSVL